MSTLPMFALQFLVSFGLMETFAPLCLDILQFSRASDLSTGFCSFLSSQQRIDGEAHIFGFGCFSEVEDYFRDWALSHSSDGIYSWSARPMYNLEKFLGISYEPASEKELLFFEINSRRKKHINPNHVNSPNKRSC
jgi:hypothetical protein